MSPAAAAPQGLAALPGRAAGGLRAERGGLALGEASAELRQCSGRTQSSALRGGRPGAPGVRAGLAGRAVSVRNSRFCVQLTPCCAKSPSAPVGNVSAAQRLPQAFANSKANLLPCGA